MDEWGLDYLISRETDALLRASSRTLPFGDGTYRHVSMFDVYWRWWDRIVERAERLGDAGIDSPIVVAQQVAEAEGLSFEQGLRFYIAYYIWLCEQDGDEFFQPVAHLELDAAKRGMRRFRERNPKRASRS